MSHRTRPYLSRRSAKSVKPPSAELCLTQAWQRTSYRSSSRNSCCGPAQRIPDDKKYVRPRGSSDDTANPLRCDMIRRVSRDRERLPKNTDLGVSVAAGQVGALILHIDREQMTCETTLQGSQHRSVTDFSDAPRRRFSTPALGFVVLDQCRETERMRFLLLIYRTLGSACI